VPVGDVAALADALARLVSDEGQRRRLAQAGRARAVAMYDWSSCVDRMLDCQDAVIAAAAAGS